MDEMRRKGATIVRRPHGVKRQEVTGKVQPLTASAVALSMNDT